MPPTAMKTVPRRAPEITEEVAGKANADKLHRTARDFRSESL